MRFEFLDVEKYKEPLIETADILKFSQKFLMKHEKKLFKTVN